MWLKVSEAVNQPSVESHLEEYQGWIDYPGTHVPMFVPRIGLMLSGQTKVCPKLWAFSMKITIWPILQFWEDCRQLCLLFWSFSRL